MPKFSYNYIFSLGPRLWEHWRWECDVAEVGGGVGGGVRRWSEEAEREKLNRCSRRILHRVEDVTRLELCTRVTHVHGTGMRGGVF